MEICQVVDGRIVRCMPQDAFGAVVLFVSLLPWVLFVLLPLVRWLGSQLKQRLSAVG